MYADHILRARLADECGINLDDYPPLLREKDIVRDPKRPGSGILPVTRPSFRDLVRNGLIPPSLKLGKRTVAWKRSDIMRVLLDGTAATPRRRSVAPTATL